MLIKSKAMSDIIAEFLGTFQHIWDSFISNHYSIQLDEIHWCIMIDNSGSMSVHRHAIYECLVMIMEVFRKMEFKFSIARFGGLQSQIILKKLNEQFTNDHGQIILEAITLNEGTYPATGLRQIAETIFPITTIHSHQQQLVLMITDGLTREYHEKNYSETLNRHSINLGILFIEMNEQSTSKLLVNSWEKVDHATVKSESIDRLPDILTQLINKMFLACAQRIAKVVTRPMQRLIIEIETPRIQKYSISELPRHQLTQEKRKQYEMINDPSLFSINRPNANIPNLIYVKRQLNDYLSQSTDRTNYVEAVDKLRVYYRSYLNRIQPEIIQNAMNWWNNEEHYRLAIIDELTLLLGDIVFPCNYFTRRRAALRGSSLYIPGLIKAMISEWTYKKIFSAKQAGPKRDHAICFVLDVSTSMFGNMADGLKDSLISLIGACRRLELDNFSLIVFGKNVRLIKTNEQPWDTSVILTLIEQLDFTQDDESKDVDALETAIDLLIHTSTRGEKKIFILTDGYGTTRRYLPLIQQRAEDARIDILAIAVGIDRVNLEKSYKHYVHCHYLNLLPKVLRNLFENQTNLQLIDDLPRTKVSILTDEINVQNDDDSDSTRQLQKYFDEFTYRKKYDSMIQQLATERNQVLEHTSESNISFDICFCLDCTGSMSGWLPHIKSQLEVSKFYSGKIFIFFSYSLRSLLRRLN
jgi:hypothetical protein